LTFDSLLVLHEVSTVSTKVRLDKQLVICGSR